MTNKTKKILSEISAGELLDKISILEIKIEKIKDNKNLEQVKKEYAILSDIQKKTINLEGEVKNLFHKLKEVNINLWNVEDKLRIHEKNKDFGNTFVELAREVYFNNDNRSKIKLEINTILGSNIKEIKQYVNY